MLTQMSDADWEIVVEAFQAARSRRGDKGRDDRKFLEAWIPECPPKSSAYSPTYPREADGSR